MNPLLKIDLDRVFFNCRELKRITKSILKDKDINLYYAIKANYNKMVRNLILDEGYGAEILSEYELDLIKPDIPVLINGHVKSDIFLEKALNRSNVQIIVESINEIENICKIYESKKLNKSIDIGIRIPFIRSRIGFNINEINILNEINDKYKFLNIDMLHFHAGWNNTDNSIYEEQLKLIFDIHNLLKNNGIKITKWNIGGSYCEYSSDKSQLHTRIKLLKSIIPNEVGKVYLEPGRFLVGDAGTLYSAVVNINDSECTINSATYGYLLSGATPSIYYVDRENNSMKIDIEENSKFKLCGIWPSDNDCIHMKEININMGDTIVFRNMGAYLDDSMKNISFDFNFDYKVIKKVYPLFKIASDEEKVVLLKFWDFNNRIFKKIPKSQGMLMSIISLILRIVITEKKYTEIELNKLLSDYFEDFATIRREMVEKKLLYKVGDSYERK